ncbi:MAG: NUDIX domain-containing protein, partial [Pseudomonadota bacterium]
MALFLFGTLRWTPLFETIAAEAVETLPARLDGWSVERAAAGDWPVLVPGGAADGVLVTGMSEGARDRLDWYETAFGYGVTPVEVRTSGGLVPAEVYREVGGAGGSGVPWDLEAWVAEHGARTVIAAEEVLRAKGQRSPAEIQALRHIIHARAHSVVMGQRFRRPVTFGSPHTAADVQVLGVSYPYDGFHRLEEWTLDHQRFDGGRSGPIKRALSHITDAATVLPYDPVRDRVMVVEQVRVGPLAKGDPLPWMLEPVAGLIDAGETAESTALREMEEEAGLTVQADALRFVSRYYPSPGAVAQVLYSFVAIC